MNIRSQILCGWAGILCPLLMFGGLIIAGYFPPQSPLMSADEVAAFYRDNGDHVRFGMILMQIAGALNAALVAVISVQMRRIEHRNAPTLTYAQLVLGAVNIIPFVLPAMLWVAASFRPERSPDVTQALHDLAWLIFVGVWALGALENLVIGFLVIADGNPRPVFPRWVGFLNIWIALLLLPMSIMPFFKSGPFAWSGLLAYWIPGIAFSMWFFIMGPQVIKAAKRQAAEA